MKREEEDSPVGAAVLPGGTRDRCFKPLGATENRKKSE
ncbi:hypothetical protein ALP68_101370 [Pseudomonas ficuserectae]|uniref:Uncharacterized protein n=9 Tax=Pseudomonas syringae group TaxID=136849 RepID=A0AAX1VST6_PSEAJ|nr:Unknown protein sequence [Pseudomonas amygdali pv. sesami]KPB63818.1 Unknown protein sequence [Pseudomonas amygdali pv. myricae]KPB96845.1 Unknown protein sequence [Pseudomonas amygdali pv. lachrymans]KPC51054.1 Unknown protein sequence [Pseudomonas amygdali pv. morsprunorum]KPW15204.1 hypothetical protein ALO90_101493 [Pseudomonas amygdali pv. aesculi]KPW42590.1 hypothetical protein ALO51_101336 [Pseudomonas amygdali]KPW44128.1 hypothetical protein ALO82_101392 [Pseudomonas syringae pv. b